MNNIQQIEEEIIKEFIAADDKLFEKFQVDGVYNSGAYEILIRTALSRQREAVWKLCEEMKDEHCTHFIVHQTLHRSGSMHERYVETGKSEVKCTALTSLQSKLKPTPKE